MAEENKGEVLAKASAKFLKVPPRKIARLARECVGKPVGEMRERLSFHPQKSARCLVKILGAAEANLKQKSDFENVVDAQVKYVTVNQGPSFKRVLFRAKGRADRKRTYTSHVSVTLSKKKDDAPQT